MLFQICSDACKYSHYRKTFNIFTEFSDIKMNKNMATQFLLGRHHCLLG